MSKLIEKDGKHYRIRRGKTVEIPEEWVGKTVYPKTIRQRPSKMTNKRARDVKRTGSWKRTRKYLEAKDNE